jgi:hypothetical protein
MCLHTAACPFPIGKSRACYGIARWWKGRDATELLDQDVTAKAEAWRRMMDGG